MAEHPEYTLKVDLNVLNHLGINLYSNVPAVLSELVANAWDADAINVSIDVTENDGDKIIIVTDDGCGMDKEDLNDKFLNVGYQRRKDASQNTTTGKNRKVMGRKGIGKLSVFSIAKTIRVITKKQDNCVGIELMADDIQNAIDRNESYHPKPLEKLSEDIKISTSAGTKIILSNLKKRTSSALDGYLRKRIARKFGVIDDDFNVKVNESLVTFQDRCYPQDLIYAYIYGNYDKDPLNADETLRRENKITIGTEAHSVNGWIGFAKAREDLQDGDIDLNKISIYTRGKMALEDILESITDARVYKSYIIGEINADFLDDTDKEDIATSNRQDFIQNDERVIRLREYIEEELKAILTKCASIKHEKGLEKATKIPVIREWYGSLRGDNAESAKKLMGKINQIADNENQYKTLLKHGILAFEYMRHNEKIRQLDEVDPDNLESVIKIFSDLDEIEASWYYQITKGRFNVIQKLNDLDNENSKERIIQEHIYDHLWLLDPSWDRATEDNSQIERTVKQGFEQVSNDLSEEELRSRIDIRYKKAAGKHVIIELKKPDVVVPYEEAWKQIDKYISALRKQLRVQNESENIEAIYITGKGLKGWDDPETKSKQEESLLVFGIRVVTYKELIKDAEVSYREYLAGKAEFGRIEKILSAIEQLEVSGDTENT